MLFSRAVCLSPFVAYFAGRFCSIFSSVFRLLSSSSRCFPSVARFELFLPFQLRLYRLRTPVRLAHFHLSFFITLLTLFLHPLLSTPGFSLSSLSQRSLAHFPSQCGPVEMILPDAGFRVSCSRTGGPGSLPGRVYRQRSTQCVCVCLPAPAPRCTPFFSACVALLFPCCSFPTAFRNTDTETHYAAAAAA